MPLYQCFSPEGTLDDDQQERIAGAITEIHTTLTTAPPTFVHVQFHDRSETDGDTPVVVSAGLRAGRPQSVTDGLVTQISAAVSDIGDIPADDISMRTVETPASWILEGGRVLPEPGEEEAWEAERAHA